MDDLSYFTWQMFLLPSLWLSFPSSLTDRIFAFLPLTCHQISLVILRLFTRLIPYPRTLLLLMGLTALRTHLPPPLLMSWWAQICCPSLACTHCSAMESLPPGPPLSSQQSQHSPKTCRLLSALHISWSSLVPLHTSAMTKCGWKGPWQIT